MSVSKGILKGTRNHEQRLPNEHSLQIGFCYGFGRCITHLHRNTCLELPFPLENPSFWGGWWWRIDIA